MTFKLNEDQVRRLIAWVKQQNKLLIYDIQAGPRSGIFSYQFIPNGGRTVVKVYCSLTGETLDLTNYSDV